MFKDARILSMLTIFVFILSACNLPSKNAATPTAQASIVLTACAHRPGTINTIGAFQYAHAAIILPQILLYPCPHYRQRPGSSSVGDPVCDQAQFVRYNDPDGSQVTQALPSPKRLAAQECWRMYMVRVYIGV
jgi:hypothetical protein